MGSKTQLSFCPCFKQTMHNKLGKWKMLYIKLQGVLLLLHLVLLLLNSVLRAQLLSAGRNGSHLTYEFIMIIWNEMLLGIFRGELCVTCIFFCGVKSHLFPLIIQRDDLLASSSLCGTKKKQTGHTVFYQGPISVFVIYMAASVRDGVSSGLVERGSVEPDLLWHMNMRSNSAPLQTWRGQCNRKKFKTNGFLRKSISNFLKSETDSKEMLY